uniref:Uncharacterized protein n=1 Tax=Aegilops tauschii subsp. strangulata TaxID=200361 RepID=A0A453G4A9_AEGTS
FRARSGSPPPPRGIRVNSAVVLQGLCPKPSAPERLALSEIQFLGRHCCGARVRSQKQEEVSVHARHLPPSFLARANAGCSRGVASSLEQLPAPPAVARYSELAFSEVHVLFCASGQLCIYCGCGLGDLLLTVDRPISHALEW